MKKIITLVLIAALTILSCFAFTSCGKPQTEFKPDGEVKGTLKLGFDAEYPPYGYLDTNTNQYAGFDIEFAKAVCQDMGYTLKLVPIEWNSKDAQLAAGTIDCIWSGFTIQGRENSYAWTVPYSTSKIVVLVKTDSNISTLADLTGKNVAVQVDSSGQTALDDNATLVETFKNGAYVTCPDYTTGFSTLNAGGYDALVIDVGVAESLIEGNSNFVILEEPLSLEQYGVGFATNNTALRDLVEASMIKLAATADTIAAKYGLSDSISIEARK